MEDLISLKEQLRLLEERLLQPGVRQSVTELESLLTDDFMEFGSSGRIYHKQEELELLPNSPVIPMTIMAFEVKILAPEIALTTYRIIKHYGQGEPKVSLRSSVWKFQQNRWQIVFHQGTPSMMESI